MRSKACLKSGEQAHNCPPRALAIVRYLSCNVLRTRAASAVLRCRRKPNCPSARPRLPSAHAESRRSSSEAHSFAAWVPTALPRRPAGSPAGAPGLGMSVMSLRGSELGKQPAHHQASNSAASSGARRLAVERRNQGARGPITDLLRGTNSQLQPPR
jgi:hypothetical protein